MVDTPYGSADLASFEPTEEDAVRWGRDWWWLTFELPRICRLASDEVRGFSLTCHVTGWLLTLRLIRDGQLQVVFIRKIDPTACVSALRRKWIAGTLTFFTDKYG